MAERAVPGERASHRGKYCRSQKLLENTYNLAAWPSIGIFLLTQGMVDILESFEVRLGKLEETILPVYQVGFPVFLGWL